MANTKTDEFEKEAQERFEAALRGAQRRGALEGKAEGEEGQSYKSKIGYEMSFIQRELDRIGAVLQDGFNHPKSREA